MDNTTLLNTPTIWINKYIQENLVKNIDVGVPIFTSSPTNIDDLSETYVSMQVLNENGKEVTKRYPYKGIVMNWDRMVQMSKPGFPHIRTEQILYYLYATEDNVWESIVKIQENILRLMNRSDESAQEINDWTSNRQVNLGTSQLPKPIDCMFYFHSFRVYQLDEARNLVNYGSVRTYGGNKFVIEFDYHQMPELTNADWKPEPKPASKYII